MVRGTEAATVAMASVSQAGKAVAEYRKARDAKRAQPDAQERPKQAQISRELPERARHGKFIDRPTEIAGIVGRVSQPPIDRLFIRRTISARMHSAAQMLRTQYEIGEMGAQDIDSDMPIGIRTAPGGVTPNDRRIDALTAYKAARRAMGRYLGPIVVAVACEEKDVAACSVAMKENPQEVMGVLKAGLKMLADHYRLMGVDHVAQDGDAARAKEAA